jgi:hypothetical protein
LTIFSLSITACAASPANTLEDDDEEEEGINLKGTFNDLVGQDTSGLDDLSYSSARDDEDYNDNMEKAAHRIEYSDSNRVCHGRRKTNFIPGGPKPPKYNGTNEVEKVMAKQEYKRCDNIHSWISLSGDLAFSHQDGIYSFKFPKRFLEISSRDLTLFSTLFSILI